jgi:hypothetical protein
MAKKALVSTIETAGNPANPGNRVLEVVDVGQEFETHSSLQWHDCPDNVESFKYWWKDNTFKPLPEAVAQVGTLAVDADGNPTQAWEWNWDTGSWSIVEIITNP